MWQRRVNRATIGPLGTTAATPKIWLVVRRSIAVLALLAVGALPNAALASPLPAAPACPVFPATNVWNKRVDALPVRTDSATLMKSIGLTAYLHPDFSSLAWNGGKGYGIPYNVVGSSTPKYTVRFQYASQSDPGPYPIPANPKIEGGSDRHLLVVDKSACKLYELFAASRTSTGAWKAGSGAIWSLTSNALRPKGWTSADAAGLPILPGLARYDEVAAGLINHALRFTAPLTRSSLHLPGPPPGERRSQRRAAADGPSAQTQGFR